MSFLKIVPHPKTGQTHTDSVEEEGEDDDYYGDSEQTCNSLEIKNEELLESSFISLNASGSSLYHQSETNSKSFSREFVQEINPTSSSDTEEILQEIIPAVLQAKNQSSSLSPKPDTFCNESLSDIDYLNEAREDISNILNEIIEKAVGFVNNKVDSEGSTEFYD